jgi:uncharacterized protein GlcG (DUF336 family)
MSLVTLQQSERIIDAILVQGRELGCRPLSIVILELGARVKAFKKEDGSAMMRFEMAFGKAFAALASAAHRASCASAPKRDRYS